MPLCIFETIAAIFETVAGNRVTIDVLAGRPLGPLTLLIIGSITMPHTQTNIHRKRNTLFTRFLMKYPGRKIILKLTMTNKDICKALPSDVDWVNSYLIIVAFFDVGGLHPSHMVKKQCFCVCLFVCFVSWPELR